MIATFAPGPDSSFDLTLSLNLEAAMVGVEPGHDTRESAVAPDYDRLRALPPDALQAKWEAFAPAFLNGIEFRLDNKRADLTVDDIAIPEAADTGLARISQIVLRGEHPGDAVSVSWGLDSRFGDSVFRIQAAGSDDVASATYVAAGSTAGPLPI